MKNQQVGPEEIKRARLSRIWKWVLSATAIVLLLLSCFAAYVNLKWRPFLTSQVKEAIAHSTDSLYSLTFEQVNVNVLTGSASFKNIVFKPDMRVYQQMVKKGSAPRHLFRVEVASLNLDRVHPWQVYFHRNLAVKSLLINRPSVKMIFRELPGMKPAVADNRTAWQRLSKYLQSVKVDHVMFQDADFQYIDQSAKRHQVTRLQNLHIGIAGLLIDSASQFDQSKLYHTEDVSIRLENYAYQTPNGMYDVNFKEFTASTRSKMAKVTGLRLNPRYGEMQFTGKLKHRKGRYDLRVDEVFLEDINYKAFNTDRRLIASRLTVSNSNANIFLNKVVPKRITDHLHTFPQIALRELNLKTRIDSVFIHNARVSYAEYIPQTRMKGQLFIDQIDGTIANVTNDPVLLAANNISRADITGLIMGRGRLNAVLDLNLTDKAAAFNLNGSVGNVNAELFNKMIRPLTLVEIRSGFIEHLKFSLRGDVRGTRGTLGVNYNDLKISLLSKNEDNTRLRKMNLASMAANVLILKSENPTPGERFRQVRMSYTRPDSVSFVSMIWKGMLGGLKETIGLDPQTQRKIAAKLNELKIVKAEREERKQVRLKRREERRQKNNR